MPTKIAKQKRKLMTSIDNIVFVLFCILLAYAPFFRGLYFEKELMPTHVFSFGLALVWVGSKYQKKEYKLIQSPLDMTALGIVFIYFISIFYAVDTRLAIGELLKYANYFFVFLLARDLSGNEKYKKWILNTLVISAIGVSLVGIGSFIGTWNYNGAVMGERIASTFQYPNTLASYLGAIFIIALGFFMTEERKVNRALYGAGSSLILFTFILTYSRGMWLILPFIILLYVIVIPNQKKLEIIMFLFFGTIVSIGFAMWFTQASDSSNYMQWTIFLLLSLVMYGITHVVSLLITKINNVCIDTKKIVIFVVIIAVFFASAIFYAFTQTDQLTMENTTNNDNWTRVYRNINNIEPNTNYTLSVNYNLLNKNEKPYAGRVTVQSIDKKGNLKTIKAVPITEPNKEQLEIDFLSFENTTGIRVYFQNYYSGTSVKFNDAKIINQNNNEVVHNIPLKYKYIPETIVRRINRFNINENSVQARLAFNKDGLKVVKDYFLSGTGGGGWSRLYTMYQSFSYTSTQAHNYFLKLWIEIGIIGLLIFISHLCLITYYSYKKWRSLKDEKSKIQLTTIFTVIILILVHAFIDFDLSLSAFAFVLWSFMGILASLIRTGVKNKYTKDKNKIMKAITIIVLILLLINSTTLTIGNSLAMKAVEDNQKGNINNAIKRFERAEIFDPYKAEYKADLATLYKAKYQQTKNREYINKAFKKMDKAQELDKHSVKIKMIGASFYMGIGQIDKGLKLINEAVDVQPMKVENYLQKSSVYLDVFNYYMYHKRDLKKAKETIEEAYEIKDQIYNINNKATQPLKYNEELLYKLGYIQFYKEDLDNSEYKIENNYVLDFAYYFDLDINGDGNIDMLRQYNSDGGQIKYEQRDQDTDDFIRITNNGEKYGIIYPYGLRLEPNTNYEVYFKARGSVKEGTFRFFVYDSKAENKRQGYLNNIKLNDEWQMIQLKFKTDSDIKPGTQYLGFQHNGNDDGYIEVEEVMVFKEVKQ